MRILGILSGVGPTLPHLDDERRQIDHELTALRESGLVDVEWLENPTALSLFEALGRKDWHVVHFAGHGTFDLERRQGQIMVASATGHGRLMSALDLRAFLKDRPSVRLVFVNACDGAVGDPQELVSSTAAMLMDAGIPAVVAMQSPVSDRLAAVFAQFMYRRLASGGSVEAAITHARKGVYLESSTEWATPVLYSRAADGVLFSFLPRAPTPQGGVSILAQAAPPNDPGSVSEPKLTPPPLTALRAPDDTAGLGAPPQAPRWRAFFEKAGGSLLVAAWSPERVCGHYFAAGGRSIAGALLRLGLAGVLLGPLLFYGLRALRWPWHAELVVDRGTEAPSRMPSTAVKQPPSADPPAEESLDPLVDPCGASAASHRWVLDVRSALCEAERGQAASALNRLASLGIAHDMLPSATKDEIKSRMRAIQEQTRLGTFRILGYEAGSPWAMYLDNQPVEAGTELIFADPGKHRIVFRNATASTFGVYQMKDRGSVSVIAPRAGSKAVRRPGPVPNASSVRPATPSTTPVPARDEESAQARRDPPRAGNAWLREVFGAPPKDTVYLRSGAGNQLLGRRPPTTSMVFLKGWS